MEQGRGWSRETPEVRLPQAHVQASTAKHARTHPCTQHAHTNTAPLEALKHAIMIFSENEWNSKLLC